MTDFLALYSGKTVNNSEVVAISADPTLVRDFAERLLGEPREPAKTPAVASIERGRRGALQAVRDSAPA
jgi:hypothetical protein